MDEKIKINSFNFFIPSISPAIFYRVNTDKKFICDERLGIGADFGSGEDTDFVLYYLSLGLKGFFFPQLFIHHPSKHRKSDVLHIKKYACGFGAVMKKGIKYYHIQSCYFIFMRYMISALLKCVIPSKTKIGRAYLQSYLRGYRDYD